MSAEIELVKWKQFTSMLGNKDRKMFDKKYDYVKLHNTACSNACSLVVIHTVIISIIFEHYKTTNKINGASILDKELSKIPSRSYVM